MSKAYPIVMTPSGSGYVVYVPDFSINTEGRDLADAIHMARDAIAMTGIVMQDDGEEIPEAGDMHAIKTSTDEFVTIVDVDFADYRRRHDMSCVRKNCTIPSWLNAEAEKAGINFSAALQKGLKAELGLSV